jgi:RHS repeat-associated protein
VTGEPTAIRENGATSGAGVLATYAWDDLGRRSSLTRGDGSVLGYTYDSVSRLTQLADNLAGTAYDQTLGFGYTPAGQIASNTAYAWTGHYNLNRGYTANGRNQYTAIASITPSYDAKGNLTSAGGTTYAYTSENLLTSASGGIALAYDPAMRLYQTSGGSAGTTRFAYDGSALIAEYNGSNAMLRRYVHGPGADEPLVWYEGSGTSDRRFLHSDERGSVVAVTNSSGTTLNVNGYDEHGIPSSGNAGRFQYTGQTWLPELGMYYYKARIYSPTLGRFLQPDPIGYGDGMNMYAYVGGDPVNASDPTGTMTYDDNQAYFVDYAEEWEAQRGPNLRPGGRSRDGMGMLDIVRVVSGRVDVLAFEREQARQLVSFSASSTTRMSHMLACWTPITCAQDLKEAMLGLTPKPQAPDKGPKAQEFAKAAGFVQGPENSAGDLMRFNPKQTMENIRNAGFTREYTLEWAKFYSLAHTRNRSNLTAFFRSEKLRGALHFWPKNR